MNLELQMPLRSFPNVTCNAKPNYANSKLSFGNYIGRYGIALYLGKP